MISIIHLQMKNTSELLRNGSVDSKSIGGQSLSFCCHQNKNVFSKIYYNLSLYLMANIILLFDLSIIIF